MKRTSKGFTLIELMIVVAIIGILAAVAMPRFADLVRKSNEGATKGKLGSIRSALSIYYADNEGEWPASLAGMILIEVDGGGSKKYMSALPERKVGGGATGEDNGETVGTIGAIDGTDGWLYNNISGDVWVNYAGTDTKGNSYTAW